LKKTHFLIFSLIEKIGLISLMILTMIISLSLLQKKSKKMPRINIEDKLWGEERFQDLLIKVQNRHVAKGMILEAILLAQRYWCSVTSPRQCIPVDEFNKLGLKPLLEVNLAKITDTGIYLCGSEDHFSWWFQRVEAGRSGGIAKSSNAKRNLAGAKQNVPSSSSGRPVS
jgi:hypothetical protein